MAEKTEEMAPRLPCGWPRSPCFSTFFMVSKLLETQIKDISRRALARCEIPGDKREGKEEFDGKEKEM